MPGPGSAYEPISVPHPAQGSAHLPRTRSGSGSFSDHSPGQIVIVNQSATEGGQRRVKALFAAWSPSRKSVRLCYIHEPAIPGAAVARDRTMEEADGLIWLFLYDDMFEVGCALVAAVGSLHRRSLEPWLAFATGVREAAALGKPVGCSSLQR